VQQTTYWSSGLCPVNRSIVPAEAQGLIGQQVSNVPAGVVEVETCWNIKNAGWVANGTGKLPLLLIQFSWYKPGEPLHFASTNQWQWSEWLCLPSLQNGSAGSLSSDFPPPYAEKPWMGMFARSSHPFWSPLCLWLIWIGRQVDCWAIGKVYR